MKKEWPQENIENFASRTRKMGQSCIIEVFKGQVEESILIWQETATEVCEERKSKVKVRPWENLKGYGDVLETATSSRQEVVVSQGYAFFFSWAEGDIDMLGKMA